MAKPILRQRKKTKLQYPILITIIHTTVTFFCVFGVCKGDGFQQILTPSQPGRSPFTINDVKIPQANTFHLKKQVPNSVVKENEFLPAIVPNPPSKGGGFLPGIGTYFQPYTINTPRDVRSPAIQENMPPVSTFGAGDAAPYVPTQTDPKVFNLDSINNEANPPIDRIDSGLLSPQNSLQAAVNGEGKCSFVQMKGTPLPNMNCQKGGMACDKQCGIVDTEEGGAGETCTTVMETMCREVPKTDCQNVTGKVCNNIADEICDPVQELEPLTR